MKRSHKEVIKILALGGKGFDRIREDLSGKMVSGECGMNYANVYMLLCNLLSQGIIKRRRSEGVCIYSLTKRGRDMLKIVRGGK